MEKDQNVITHFLKYQAIYVVIIGLVVSWTVVGTRLDALEEDLVKNELRIKSNSLNSAEINTKLASIETSLEFIKAQLKIIK